MNRNSAAYKPALRRGKRWITQGAVVVLVSVCGAIVSLALFLELRGRESDRMRRAFEQAASDRISALKKTMQIDSLLVQSVKSYFDGSDKVERREFRIYAGPLFEGRPSIQALEWVPRVPDAQRPSCEDEARREGCADFLISQYGPTGSLVSADRRPQYFPVFYVEPDKGNVAALGFDLATDPACREAMDRACRTGRLAATSRIALGPKVRGQFGLRILLPVYRKNVLLETAEVRQRSLDGFVVGLLRLDGILEESMSALATVGVDIHVFDSSAPQGEQLICSHRSRQRESPATPAGPQAFDLRSALHSDSTFDIAQRRWTVVCAPAPGFIAARTTWQPGMVALAALALTALLAAYLPGAAVQSARTERLARDCQLAEEVARREYAKLSAMISGMEEGVVFADANSVLVEVNDCFCRFVERPREEILGKRIEDLHQGMPLERIVCQIERFREQVGAGPLVIQRPLGDKEVIMRMQPIYRDARYDGALLNVIDVSELVKARRQAEMACKAKSDFLAKMSHDIRTPMTAILGYTDLLMDAVRTPSDRQNYLAVIRRNGQHLLSLINDILDLSKIEAGKLAIEMGRCSLTAVLADVASTMRPDAEQRGDSLRVEYAGELPETILTDGARLRQALVNLVGNAVKFTEHGSVRIVVGFLRDGPDRCAAVKIEVIDTGIGIREEALSRLFEPFVQADASTAREFGGTGLGLVISRNIVELLGGELTVQSTFGRGSTFAIALPTGDLEGIRMLRCPSEAAEAGAVDLRHWAMAPELAGVRVLLAEDGLDNQELVRTVLEIAGAQVELAENGRIALSKAEAATFDVILMDMNMPEMDGYEATRTLRDRGYHRPILALTANAMSGDSQRCLAAGCNECLAKPIDRGRLIRTIAQFAAKSAAGGDPVSEPPPGLSGGEGEVIRSLFAGDPAVRVILERYVAGLGDQVIAMRQSLAQQRYEDLQRLAHKMNGSARSYGYPSLSAAAKKLEDAAKDGNCQTIELSLERVASLCRAIDAPHTLQTP